MITEALQFLKQSFRKETVEVNGRYYVLNQHDGYNEVENRYELSLFTRGSKGILMIGTIQSLLDFINSYREHCSAEHIIRCELARDGITAYFDVNRSLKNDQWNIQVDLAKVPFFTRWHPSTEPFSYTEFLEYLDQHAGNIDNEDQLRASIKELTFSDSSEIKVEDRGAYTVLKRKEETATIAGQKIEGAEVKLPKEININLPTGTREFEIRNTFLFRIDTKYRTFSLIPKHNDGSYEEFLSKAKTMLSEGLSADKNVILLEGV